jgi:hypothetical protein
MSSTDSQVGAFRRALFYGAVTLLIAGSFLAEILRGDCPVP